MAIISSRLFNCFRPRPLCRRCPFRQQIHPYQLPPKPQTRPEPKEKPVKPIEKNEDCFFYGSFNGKGFL